MLLVEILWSTFRLGVVTVTYCLFGINLTMYMSVILHERFYYCCIHLENTCMMSMNHTLEARIEGVVVWLFTR